MFYVLHMRGCKPTYYTAEDKARALNTFAYMRQHFAGVSLTIQDWKRVVKDMVVTERTA
jgi:hypothetical protein